jgi:pantoate--beta-alanine ligase
VPDTILIGRVADLRHRLDDARRAGATVGFVPTMGAFHEGHQSLMRRARAEQDVVVVSLFVNPLQFGAPEDLDLYPRDPDGDFSVVRELGVDILFTPPVDEVYPVYPPATTVRVTGLTERLEGESRPGHFDGVATVGTKLFAMVGPCAAYFGQKDAQQLAVVRRLAADLCLPVEVVGCPLVRERDGLAMSSRNRRLTDEQRRAAAVIHRGLRAGADLVEGGEIDTARLRRVVANVLTTEPLVRLEYAEVVDAATLRPLETLGAPTGLGGGVLVAVAARVGDVRLIDNMTISTGSQGASVDLGVFVPPSISGGPPEPPSISGVTPEPPAQEASCAAG